MAENDFNERDVQQPDREPPAENEGQGERMYSKEEVSRIVQDRLAQQKAKFEKPTDREMKLIARESRLTCKEYLIDSGAPAVLLDILDTSDPEKFKEAVEKLKESGYGAGGTPPANYGAGGIPPARSKTGMSHQGSSEVGGLKDGDLADAFKPKVR